MFKTWRCAKGDIRGETGRQLTDLLLINPPLTLRERYGDLAAGGSTLPPLGLANVAASVRAAGFNVKILDAAILELSADETLKRIKELAPKIVGITGATIAVRSMFEIAGLVKNQCPNVIVILGGAHISAAPEATFKRYGNLIDAAVIGEGDYSSVALVDALLNGKPIDDIKGLAFMKDGEIAFTRQGEVVKDLDALPMAARDLLPRIPDHYHPAANCYLRAPSTSIITSRGCSGRCAFCDRTVSTGRLRGHSAERLVETIDALVRDYGIRDVIMYDDNFVALRSRLHRFCEALVKKNNPVSWSCIARADMVGKEELEAMKRAGCWQIAYGVESGSPEILKSLNKGLTHETIRETLELTRKAGISTRGYFMIGVPGESVATIKQTLNFMKSVALDDFHISFFTPWPASDLYHRIKDSGYYDDIDDHWDEMNGWGPAYVPDGMTAGEVVYWHRKIFLSFYLRPSVIFRYLMNSVKNPELLLRMAQGGVAMLGAMARAALKKGVPAVRK